MYSYIGKVSLKWPFWVQQWPVLYSKPCYNEPCYKEVEVYLAQIQVSVSQGPLVLWFYIFQNYCSLWPETYWDNEDMWVLKVKVIYIWKLKLAFLRNQSKPDFICKLSGTWKWKFIDTMVVTLPRWPPWPYMVKTLQKSSSPEPVDWFPRNLVCRIGDSCQL